MPNLPSTKITIKEPKIANDIDEYVSLVKTLKNESNPKPYRIVYFYSFYDWSDSYDPYDSHEAINLAKCIHTLSTKPHFVQLRMNNSDGSFSERLGLHYNSGIVFYRNNLIINYMSGFNFDNFLDIVNTLSSAPVKHSPKRQRLLEEKANSAKKSNKASSSNGCIIC